MVDDDLDDCQMAAEALKESRVLNPFFTVGDGEECMDFLYHRGKYNDVEKYPTPGLILLDLNMPRKDGRETLKEIKQDPALKRMPIVILTTSKAEEDVYRSYELGVNSYIVKPITFEGLVKVMKTLGEYWLTIVELPVIEVEKQLESAVA
ncbi:response regulator [bacterium]|nr:response regulator [bacterium]MBU1937309.1 response regulator [bacterium]